MHNCVTLIRPANYAKKKRHVALYTNAAITRSCTNRHYTLTVNTIGSPGLMNSPQLLTHSRMALIGSFWVSGIVRKYAERGKCARVSGLVTVT